MGRSEEELERVKARLRALSASMPELIERLQGRTASPVPDPEQERQRLAAFADYLECFGRGRADGDAPGDVDVREVLEGAVALARTEIEPKARVATGYLPAPIVRANGRHLGQVFVSLLVNAAQALPDGAPESHRVDIGLDTGDGGWARVAIADTGAGISADALPHIFEPLYSTKRGAGMGVGLAIVREIVQGAGGRISVESTPGVGTLFIIELPPARAS